MALSSHPVAHTIEPSSSDDDDDGNETSCVDDVAAIRVTQSPGFLCHISAKVTIPLSPQLLWEQCLVHPDNAEIYRHMDRCSYRRVLSTSPEGVRRVEVAHEASWRFLVFSGTFITRLDVTEDHEKKVMKFKMLPSSSIVSKFQGEWAVAPHPTDPDSCVSTLDQDLALGVWMPPPMDRILKGISCRQVRRIVEDLQAEAAKINAGHPTLVPYETVKDKAIGWDGGGERGSGSGSGDIAENWEDAGKAI